MMHACLDMTILVYRACTQGRCNRKLFAIRTWEKYWKCNNIFSFFFAEIVRVGDCLLFAVCCAQRKSKVAKWSEFAKNCEETWRKTKTEIDRFVYSARNCVWVSYTDSELLWVYYSIRWTDEWYRKCDDNAYAVWLEEPAVRFIRRYNAQLQFGFSTKCRSNYV